MSEARASRVALGALVALLLAAAGGCGGDDEKPAVHAGPQHPTGPARPVPGARGGGRQPNVLVVMTDDQNYRDLRVMPRVRSLLADHGTSFSHFYSTFPLCCPARTTLLTGQYAHNHGVLSNKPPDGGYPALRRRADTLGSWLQEAGYRTGWIGKFLNAYGREGAYEIPPGWSQWQVPVELTELRMYGYRLNENGTIVDYGDSPGDYQTDVLAAKAVDYVSAAAGGKRPFFLVFSPLAPHDEADTIDTGSRDPRPAPRDFGAFAGRAPRRPPSFNERDVSDKPPAIASLPPISSDEIHKLKPHRLGRLESLLAVDDAVAALVRELRRSGQLRDTVILFTSDNGLLLGEHRLATAKAVPYEEATRVPLIVRGPGFPAGVTRRRPVGNVDLAPTILDLAGASPTRLQDGFSLLPAAAGEATSPTPPVLIESSEWSGVRDGSFSYVEYDDGAREMYDLSRDPFELRNLARAHAGPAQRSLARELDELRDCAGPACR